MSLRVTFWGTRGSIAKAGPSTVRYGGNTSCVEIRSEAGTLFVLDCGTGAHGLGIDLCARAAGEPVHGHLLISHTHWDHIQGLPFFAPLFSPGNKWHVYGPRGLGNSLAETLAGQMQYSYFPITVDQLGAHVEYHDLVEGQLTIADTTVVTQYLNHPALTLGYRLEVDGSSVVYSSDHEPHDRELGAGGDLATSRSDVQHAAFLENADLVIHDTQYLAEEYPHKVGWGHSTVEYVVDACMWASVRQLALFHHDPTRDDEAVDRLIERARARVAAAGSELTVIGAAEGRTIEVRGTASVPPARPAHRAMERPALDELRRVVLIAVAEPDVAAVLCTAAEDEGMEVIVARGSERALELAESMRPSFVLLDHGPTSFAMAHALRLLDPPYGGDVGLVAVTRTGRTDLDDDGLAITDWLTWPASGVYVRTKLRSWLLRRAVRWQNAPLPPDEHERIAALVQLEILDTGPEERFDRYTKLASEVFEVPIALVSLIDSGRQWFKSRVGIDADETPRDLAFCAHAILDNEILHVTDALEDDRFADNPLVTGHPRLRFYAGVPLTLSNGANVGTFCVLDYRPRRLDEDQLAELRRLGALVVEQLEKR